MAHFVCVSSLRGLAQPEHPKAANHLQRSRIEDAASRVILDTAAPGDNGLFREPCVALASQWRGRARRHPWEVIDSCAYGRRSLCVSRSLFSAEQAAYPQVSRHSTTPAGPRQQNSSSQHWLMRSHGVPSGRQLHTLGSPPPPHVSSLGHVSPQFSSPPHPSAMSPQFLPSASHVVFVQPQTPGVPGFPPPQVWGELHFTPHAPQFAASLFVSTHAPAQ